MAKLTPEQRKTMNDWADQVEREHGSRIRQVAPSVSAREQQALDRAIINRASRS